MVQSFLTPFLTILLAEMLDKSQLALIFLSTKTKNYLSLFLGSILAFVLVDGLAVLFGSFIATLVPDQTVHIIAGLVFVLFGILAFRKEKENKERETKWTNSIFLSSFLLIFLSEWADKTQLASAAFATQFDPLFVFLGVMMAMIVLAILAIFGGRILTERVNKSLLTKVSGVVFIGIGVYLLVF